MNAKESIAAVALEVLVTTDEVDQAMQDLRRHSNDLFLSEKSAVSILASAVRTLLKAYFRLWKETHGKQG